MPACTYLHLGQSMPLPTICILSTAFLQVGLSLYCKYLDCRVPYLLQTQDRSYLLNAYRTQPAYHLLWLHDIPYTYWLHSTAYRTRAAHCFEIGPCLPITTVCNDLGCNCRMLKESLDDRHVSSYVNLFLGKSKIFLYIKLIFNDDYLTLKYI